MTETHPWGDFVPTNAKYLILGSFPGKRVFGNDWYYGARGNQFWPIMSTVYKSKLETKKEKQNLLGKENIALSDVILACERVKNSNLDVNLKNLKFNTKAIEVILEDHSIQKIFFSSRYVENLYRRNFDHLISKYPNIKLFTLPSPSPRYAMLTKAEKIKRYKRLLPKK